MGVDVYVYVYVLVMGVKGALSRHDTILSCGDRSKRERCGRSLGRSREERSREWGRRWEGFVDVMGCVGDW